MAAPTPATSAPSSSYMCGQCGDGRDYPSKDFPELTCKCLKPLSQIMAAEIWEKERDAFINKEYCSGIQYALLGRAQEIGKCCFEVPTSLVVSCSALALSCLSGLASALCCCSGAVCCVTDDCDDSKGAGDCLDAGLNCGVVSGASLALSAVSAIEGCEQACCFPINVTCPEVPNLCGIHNAHLWVATKAHKLVTSIEKPTETKIPQHP